MSNSEVLKDKVANAQSAVDTTPITNAANDAVNNLKNQVETTTGQIAGQVEGGIQSLTSKVDKFQDKLNTTTVEGLVDDGIESLEGMATDAVAKLATDFIGKFGSSVKVTFTEPDSAGMVYPLSASLVPQGGINPTVASIIQAITGLGLDAGSLQKAVVEGSPQGLMDASKDLVGQIGAFSGAEAIASLTETAVNSVTDVLKDATTGALSQIVDAGDNVLNSINKNLSFPSGWDSNGEATAYTAITGAMENNDSAFNQSMAQLSGSITDLRATVTSAQEIKANKAGEVSDLANLSGGKDGKTVQADVDRGAEYRSLYDKKGSEYRTLVNTKIANNSKRGIIQGLNQDTLKNINKEFYEFTFPRTLSVEQITDIVDLCQGDAAEFSEAVRKMSDITKKEHAEIKTFLRTIDTTIFSATAPILSDKVFGTPYVIGSFRESWKQGAGDPSFPYISSREELQADLKNLSREVTEVVTHWTETHTNKNIGSEEINKYHIAAGLDGIGYHYVIRRDGSLQRGRPLNIEGQHSPNNNHDKRSIGIVFVGGINVPSETPNSENFLSAQSLTRSQINTFDHFCRATYNILPGAQIVGHSNIDEDEFDPGFDVISYVRSNFGKKSKFTTPLTQVPFTIDELLTNDK